MSPDLAAARALPALLGREHAVLEFNRRVLAQARRPDVPLLERLRYICIVSSNMDELFEVRFADYIEAAREPGAGVSQRDLEAVEGVGAVRAREIRDPAHPQGTRRDEPCE